MYRKLLIVCLALVLAACAPAATQVPTPVIPTETAVPVPTATPQASPTPFPEKFEGKGALGELTLPIWCEGSGEPTIILERGPQEDKGWTKYDNSRFSKITRTCYYERLGIATGDTFTEPRTVMDQVKELHNRLKQTGVPGPYILVSYYRAVNNLILYTDQYPQDVAGLVLVIPLYPTYYDYELKKFGPVTSSSSAERKAEIQLIKDYKDKKVFTWDTHPEYLDQVASEAQVLKVASLKDIPLTILVSETWYATGAFSEPELNQLFWDAVQESIKDLCKLSSNCRMVMVPGTDLFSIPYNKAVDKAIQEIYDAVKSD